MSHKGGGFVTEFEIIFVVFGFGACIVGAIHVTIAYRSSIRDVEPDPERVRVRMH